MSNRYNTSDIMLTDDGDFALDGNQLEVATQNDLIEQTVLICLKTTDPDWYGDSVGAGLDSLLGLDNSRTTANLGRDKIIQALIKTGFFEEQDIWVEATPTDASTITYILFINSPFSSSPLTYRIDLELGSGVQIRRTS